MIGAWFEKILLPTTTNTQTLYTDCLSQKFIVRSELFDQTIPEIAPFSRVAAQRLVPNQ